MKYFLGFLIFCSSLLHGQNANKLISCYLTANHHRTLYDRTIKNNIWGMGLGLQVFMNNRTKFKPTAELTANLMLENIKIAYLTNGQLIDPIETFTNLLGGLSYNPNQQLYFGFLAGVSTIKGRMLATIKPSVGAYFNKKQKSSFSISYLNVFEREPISQENFGSINFSLGLKLF
jgi:hypothetical protein